MRRILRAGVVPACIFAVAVTAAVPATREYLLDVPDGRDSSFQVDFEVEHPGRLLVLAEWSGARIVAFRVEGPGNPAVRERRSGPSPQRMEIAVDEATISAGRGWKLAIRALPARGAATGTIRLDLPDAPEIVAEARKKAEPPPPPPPAPPRWVLPVQTPLTAEPEIVDLYAYVERYRTLVVGPDGTPAPDACAWQADLLRRISSWRDGLTADEPIVSESTSRFYSRLAASVREIDLLRSSKDPVLSGPPPDDSLRRRAWERARKERIRPLEQELDMLAEALRKGIAPDLEEEPWLPRLLACLTACERHFESLFRLGAAEAVNTEMARAQWAPIVAAVAALEALEPASAASRASAARSASPPAVRP